MNIWRRSILTLSINLLASFYDKSLVSWLVCFHPFDTGYTHLLFSLMHVLSRKRLSIQNFLEILKWTLKNLVILLHHGWFLVTHLQKVTFFHVANWIFALFSTLGMKHSFQEEVSIPRTYSLSLLSCRWYRFHLSLSQLSYKTRSLCFRRWFKVY